MRKALRWINNDGDRIDHNTTTRCPSPHSLVLAGDNNHTFLANEREQSTALDDATSTSIPSSLRLQLHKSSTGNGFHSRLPRLIDTYTCPQLSFGSKRGSQGSPRLWRNSLSSVKPASIHGNINSRRRSKVSLLHADLRPREESSSGKNASCRYLETHPLTSLVYIN